MKLKIIIAFCSLLVVACASVITFEIYATYTPDHYETSFAESDIEFTYRDDGYIRVNAYWFRNKCCPYVAKYFIDNKISYVEQAMDCEDLAELFIALVKSKYNQDFKDANGNFTRPKKALAIGHIITKYRKLEGRHNAVVIDIDGEWKVIEPIEFCKAITINPLNHAFAYKTFKQVLESSVIESISF